MTQGLNRYQLNGDLHFITFSCFQLKPYLASPQARSRFEDSLERMRSSYKFCIMGYVVMPEHVHMLLSEPAHDPLFKAIHALKLSVSKLSRQHPFWQARYYDFNVFTARKHVEKLRYIHRNPVRRGLVATPGRLAMVKLYTLCNGSPRSSRNRIVLDCCCTRKS
jgi:putative transposase